MFESIIYQKRRETLISKMSSGLVLILGNNEAAANYPDNTYKFRQDSTFNYFFGLKMPGFAGLLDVDSGESILFGDDFEIGDIIWMGPQPLVKDLGEKVGVSNTQVFSKLFDYVKKAISDGRKIHFLPPYRYRNMVLIEELTGIKVSMQQEYSSIELVNNIVSMRSIKEACEVEELRIAANIGYKMHVAAMKHAMPGAKENYITGVVEGIAASYGTMVSFPVILSQNGETLHNHDHSQILTEGRMMLTDAGAEANSGYCSDFTRTVPVGGRFSTRQKEIYNSVLAANEKAKSISRPGITYKDVHLEACKVLASSLKDLGIMKGDIDAAVAAGAHALFMPHGLGHMMGLDVHDMEDYGQINVGYDSKTRPAEQFGLASLRLGRTLEEGFVITNEPGCYFIPALIDKWKAEGLHKDFLNYDVIETYKDFGGIRLEDDLLITANSCELIGDERIPITVEDVENTMNNK